MIARISAHRKISISIPVFFFLFFVFFRIKRGGALYIWLPCMVDLRDPKFWFKMVTEELPAQLCLVQEQLLLTGVLKWDYFLFSSFSCLQGERLTVLTYMGTLLFILLPDVVKSCSSAPCCPMVLTRTSECGQDLEVFLFLRFSHADKDEQLTCILSPLTNWRLMRTEKFFQHFK